MCIILFKMIKTILKDEIYTLEERIDEGTVENKI